MTREEFALFPILGSNGSVVTDLKMALRFGIGLETLRDLLDAGLGPNRAIALVQGAYYFAKCMGTNILRNWFLKEATDEQVVQGVDVIWRHEKHYDLSQAPHETDRMFVARVFSPIKSWQVK